MDVETKRRLAELILHHSKPPRGIEISVLKEQDLRPLRFPTPFDFHYSEEWRKEYETELSSGEWRHWNEEREKDPDLAARVTVTLSRGICLYGKPIEEVFPPVPKEHNLASIMWDFEWARDHVTQKPVYCIHDLCRVYGYLREGRILSKEEA